MSGISGVGSGSSTAELMNILQKSQQQSMELVDKLLKVANTNQVSQAEATGLGQVLDLYA